VASAQNTSLELTGFATSGERVTVTAEVVAGKGDRPAELQITARTLPGWHIYSITQKSGGPKPTRINLTASDQYRLLGPFQANPPAVVHHYDFWPDLDVEEHEGSVTWSVPIEPTQSDDLRTLVISGDVKGQLTLTATLADKWHVYAYEKRVPSDSMRSRPTLIVLDKRSGLEAGAPRASTPLISKPREALPEYVDNFHPGDVSWTIDLDVPATVDRGDHHLSGFIGFMACSENECAPPKAARFDVNVTIGTHSDGTAAVSFTPSSYQEATEAASAAPPWDLVIPKAAPATFFAILANMGWALIAGILLNVMPCVLPVIGLKVMSFVQQAGEDRLRIFTLNFAFSLGLISIFLVLASFAAFAGLAWAEQFQDPRFGIAMAALVFVFALSLLGIWEIPIPGFVGSGSAQSIAEREGLSAAFFKGVLTTLLATPCVGPFMFTGLTFAAEQHSVAITYAIFGSMGFGMALPFLFIGIFPAWIRFLPKPGAWMESFKHLMGFVLLATVVWIYYAFIPERFFVPTLALLFGLWLACWWANRTPITANFGDRLYAWIIAFSVAILIGYVSFTQLTGPERIAKDGTGAVVLDEETNDSWQPFSTARLEDYRDQGTTVLVDFTADG